MHLGQDPKYRGVDGVIVNRRNGEAILADEPVFILRARDVHAREALEADACVLMPGEYRDAVCQRVTDFARFSYAHPDRMKSPDTAPAAS